MPPMGSRQHAILGFAAARRRYARSADTAVELFDKVYGMSLEDVDRAFLAFHRVKVKRR